MISKANISFFANCYADILLGLNSQGFEVDYALYSDALMAPNPGGTSTIGRQNGP